MGQLHKIIEDMAKIHTFYIYIHLQKIHTFTERFKYRKIYPNTSSTPASQEKHKKQLCWKKIMKPVFNGICSGPYMTRAIGLGTFNGHGRLNLSHLDKFYMKKLILITHQY